MKRYYANSWEEGWLRKRTAHVVIDREKRNYAGAPVAANLLNAEHENRRAQA